MDRLYTDVDAHTAEEARRFGLVEERWGRGGAGGGGVRGQAIPGLRLDEDAGRCNVTVGWEAT